VRQGAIEVLILIGVVGAVAAIVTFNPFKEPLPNAQMTELKAGPQFDPIPQHPALPPNSEPSVQDGSGKIIDGELLRKCFDHDDLKATSFPGGGLVLCYVEGKDQSKQIRALTKRIEEMEKHLGPWTEMPTDSVIHNGPAGDYVYCSNATIEECYKQYGITASSR